MKGEDIIQRAAEFIKTSANDDIPLLSEGAHMKLMEIHARALACHCECLGMNAENSYAACIGKQIPYNDDSYLTTMRKWGLIDKDQNPII